MPISILIITSRMNTYRRRGNMGRFREIAAMERRPAITGGNEEPSYTWTTLGFVGLVLVMIGFVVGVMLL